MTSPPSSHRSAAAPLAFSSLFSRLSLSGTEKRRRRRREKEREKEKEIDSRVYCLLDGNLWYFENRIIRLPISYLFALEQGKLLFLPLSIIILYSISLFYALAIHDFECII
jgi:hypothetical protein